MTGSVVLDESVSADINDHIFDYDTAKAVFNQEVGYILFDKKLATKYGTMFAHTKDELETTIREVKECRKEYKWAKSLDVVNENGKDILCRNISSDDNIMINQILSLDEIFNVLAELHMCQPGLSVPEVVNKCANIIIPETIKCLFFKSCHTCNLTVKGLDVHYRAVAEITIITLGTPDKGFADMFMYIERNTNFIILRPLSEKSTEEIAYELLTIFSDFGPPSYIDCNMNNALFKVKILDILKVLQLPFKIPLIYTVNKNHKTSIIFKKVKCMLEDWMKQSNCTNWAIGALKVQWSLNSNKVDDTYIRSRVVNGLIHSPYHALFGILPNVEVLEMKPRLLSPKPKPPEVEKVLIDCSQCYLPMYKTFKCNICNLLCHFSCCERNVQEVMGILRLVNKCLSCVNNSSSMEETILGT